MERNLSENDTVNTDSKRHYEKPVIMTEEIFERTALACNGSAFPNAQWDTKDNSSTCGFNDS